MTHLSRRSALGLAAAAAVAPLAATLPARATASTSFDLPVDCYGFVKSARPNQAFVAYNSGFPARDEFQPLTGPVYEPAEDGEPAAQGVRRSWFRVPLSKLAGLTVDNAFLIITLLDSKSPLRTPVDLYRVSDIDNSFPAWSDSDSPAFWLQRLATVSASAYNAQPQPLQFDSSALFSGVRTAVAEGSQSISFGLRSPSENDRAQYKKFDGFSPRLIVSAH
ncbi:hypothetical protein ACFTSF_37300 [Kribbella sp. NPDC056951]|uniref:hypothetical protein n=1 Tax=Kribbella sp. NPDC056951 TaxID=3345978 RepID=UPI003641A4E0